MTNLLAKGASASVGAPFTFRASVDEARGEVRPGAT
jgi:hypothetical protein